MKLDAWQQEVLDTDGNIVLRSGRQVGKSTVISIKAGEYAAKNSNKTIMIIAAVERQAYLLFEKVLAYLESNYSKMVKKGKDRPTKTKVKLYNGSTIYCLPTGLTGYGIRGYTVDLLIADEAAFIPEDVWTAVTPMLATTGGKLILLSTPHGKKGYFYERFQDDSFNSFHISSEEVASKRQEPQRSDMIEHQAKQKERRSKREYAQEYLGEFIDELQQFFPDELIKECMRARSPQNINVFRNYVLGVDVARKGKDQSTFEIIRLTEQNRLIQVENQITTKTFLSDTTTHIINLDKQYHFKKIFIDDGGIGVGVFDYLINNSQTRRKTIPLNNAQRVIDYNQDRKKKLLKEDLYNNLLHLMERGEIDLLDDPEIFQSMKSVQYEYTSDKQGKPQLKIFGTYTHITEGLIRAAWAIKYKNLKIWVA